MLGKLNHSHSAQMQHPNDLSASQLTTCLMVLGEHHVPPASGTSSSGIQLSLRWPFSLFACSYFLQSPCFFMSALVLCSLQLTPASTSFPFPWVLDHSPDSSSPSSTLYICVAAWFLPLYFHSPFIFQPEKIWVDFTSKLSFKNKYFFLLNWHQKQKKVGCIFTFK